MQPRELPTRKHIHAWTEKARTTAYVVRKCDCGVMERAPVSTLLAYAPSTQLYADVIWSPITAEELRLLLIPDYGPYLGYP